VLPGVPTVWHVLVSLQGLAERELPHLRLLTNAGAALSAARVADVRRTFPHADLLSMYGQTECKRVCYLPADQIEARPDSVGFPIPGTEAWIENERGEFAGPGEVGELMIRGDHVMQGYWRDAEGTAAKLQPGRFPGDRLLCSGDLFRRDEDGYLYFVSRTDDIIMSRGEKIAPGEVERVLYAIDGVREAAVRGAPDDRLGEAVIAPRVACRRQRARREGPVPSLRRSSGGLHGLQARRDPRRVAQDRQRQARPPDAHAGA
jgi:acyl-coenzyme A synthetase/AMP-(fatty) acid ligase